MNREKAIKELNRVFGPLDEDFNRVIGTPELRAQFYNLDEWNRRYPDFNPTRLIALEEEGGYSWHFYAVFRNINKSFVLVSGSGGSDYGPGSQCTLDFFANVDQILANLKSKMVEQARYDEDWAKVIYRQVLTWVATRGQRTK